MGIEGCSLQAQGLELRKQCGNYYTGADHNSQVGTAAIAKLLH
jgi:hypothetical protein